MKAAWRAPSTSVPAEIKNKDLDYTIRIHLLEREQTFHTLRAFKRACSSSKAACFSLSSTLVKDMPVLAKDDTALESVLALQKPQA